MPIKKKEEKVTEIKEERRKIQRDFEGLISTMYRS